MRTTTPGRMLAPVLTALLLLALAPAAGATAAGGDQHGRGALLWAEPLYTLATPGEVVAELESAGFGTEHVRHGVRAFRLIYRTVDAHGDPTVASGLLTLPHGRRGALRAVSYAHGSELHRAEAPSTAPHGFNAAPAVTYAAAGFAGVAPDYLGLGLGPGTHPWLNLRSASVASLDMLRAARRFLPLTDRSLRPSVLATGFSQGAAAAMGLGRLLQAGADRRFTLGALAPNSGAYDLREVQLPAMLDGELPAKLSVLNAAYALVAFDRVFDVYREPAQVFLAPYADTVEGLIDGSHSWRELAMATPATLAELLTTQGRQLLANPTGGMARALRDADSGCRGWAPRVPLRLYLAGGDEQVANANTISCRDDLGASGVRAPVVDLGAHDHQGSRHFGANVRGTAATASWFTELTPS
ncbi:lipase [Amycolatopsis aidingensis]|uniref:lipase n=1 Tax=Amycolatopsis aidingensis TaxID=2842453 RepID=UPI001C0C1E63|nr:lipase [Amycolatopsis aidingensis]